MSLARYACRYELCPVLHPVMPIALYEPCTVLLHVRVGHPLIRYSLARLSECNCVLCLVRLSPAESPGVANVAIRSGLWVRRRCKRVKSKKEKKKKLYKRLPAVSACLLVLCVCAGPKPRLVTTSLHSATACGLPLPRSLHAVRLRSRWRCQRVGDQSTAHTPRTVAWCRNVVGAYTRGLTSTRIACAAAAG